MERRGAAAHRGVALMYECLVVADSLHPNGRDRLTTLELVLPRPFLAELNTHRDFSRNSESSRAKPPERRLEEMQRDLWVPTFGSRVKGMGQGDLPDTLQAEAQDVWRRASYAAAGYARHLLEIGVDKSHINRLLEPFLWQRVLVTTDKWENFLALRMHEDAAPEMQIIARMVDCTLQTSTPRPLEENVNGVYEPHAPYCTPAERTDFLEGLVARSRYLRWSAGRCFTVSYDNTRNAESGDVSYERAERGDESGHMSPFEHQAWPMTGLRNRRRKYRGNLRGSWVQFRKVLIHEDRFDKKLAMETQE